MNFRNYKYNPIQNNKGLGTIIAVVGIALFIFILLGIAQGYVLRSHAYVDKIRRSYRATFLMEDLSVMVNTGVEIYYRQATIGGVPEASKLNFPPLWAPPTCPGGLIPVELPGSVPSIGGCFTQSTLCVENAFNQSFCM